jgi:hypothetical protein
MPPFPAGPLWTHPMCGVPHYDTLSHPIPTYPLACQVWSWSGTLRESLTGHRLPTTLAVLRPIDHRPWRPPQGTKALWV